MTPVRHPVLLRGAATIVAAFALGGCGPATPPTSSPSVETSPPPSVGIPAPAPPAPGGPPLPQPSALTDVMARLADPAVPGTEKVTLIENGTAGEAAGLDRFASKAGVHFEAFARLLRWVWELSADGRPAHVCGDKHGGRHYYLEPLLSVFPEAWIDRGAEGPELSAYTIRGEGRTLHLRLRPRADAGDGFVALASIVSKTLREEWMDVFNAFWAGHVPGLRPTAGYPVDAARFRRAVEPSALTLGVEPRSWWRAR